MIPALKGGWKNATLRVGVDQGRAVVLVVLRTPSTPPEDKGKSLPENVSPGVKKRSLVLPSWTLQGPRSPVTLRSKVYWATLPH